jgi:hypothetical protein
MIDEKFCKVEYIGTKLCGCVQAQGLSMARAMAKDLLEVKLNQLSFEEWQIIPLPITIVVVPIDVNFHQSEA